MNVPGRIGGRRLGFVAVDSAGAGPNFADTTYTRCVAGSKDAPPFLEHFQSIGKMVHRVDAKDRVEGIIIERQWGIGVRDFKCYPISLIGVGHAQSGGSDSCLIGVTRQLTLLAR